MCFLLHSVKCPRCLVTLRVNWLQPSASPESSGCPESLCPAPLPLELQESALLLNHAPEARRYCHQQLSNVPPAYPCSWNLPHVIRHQCFLLHGDALHRTAAANLGPESGQRPRGEQTRGQRLPRTAAPEDRGPQGQRAPRTAGPEDRGPRGQLLQCCCPKRRGRGSPCKYFI